MKFINYCLIIISILSLIGCQSIQTALKMDSHVRNHPITKSIDSESKKNLVHVFVEHKWIKDTKGYNISVSGYVRDPQARSFLHDIGLFKKDPSNLDKYLDRAYVEIVFLDNDGNVVSEERVKVNKKYVLHGSHSHRSKFRLKVEDNPEFAKCVLKLKWS